MQELNIQIDKFEADIETLSASLKKKKSDKDVSIEMNNELKVTEVKIQRISLPESDYRYFLHYKIPSLD